MINRYDETMTRLPSKAPTRKASPRFPSAPLEVNVIFTDPQATAAALKFVRSFAGDLGARIRLRAAVGVPFPLALEEPPVPVAFLQEALRNLASQAVEEGFVPTVHLYLCRDRVRALVQALRPNSLVVLGGRKHWWPTAETRMADALRSEGHRVVFVDSAARSANEQPVFVR